MSTTFFSFFFNIKGGWQRYYTQRRIFQRRKKIWIDVDEKEEASKRGGGGFHLEKRSEWMDFFFSIRRDVRRQVGGRAGGRPPSNFCDVVGFFPVYRIWKKKRGLCRQPPTNLMAAKAWMVSMRPSSPIGRIPLLSESPRVVGYGRWTIPNCLLVLPPHYTAAQLALQAERSLFRWQCSAIRSGPFSIDKLKYVSRKSRNDIE